MSLPLLDQHSLDKVAARAAPALAHLGLAAGRSVAVVARNRPELLVVDAAAALQGASVVHVDPDGSAIDADRALTEAIISIAQSLSISHDTVKLHVRHILAKLGQSSRVEAAVFAVQNRAALGMDKV